jgi:hypothetical protein
VRPVEHIPSYDGRRRWSARKTETVLAEELRHDRRRI